MKTTVTLTSKGQITIPQIVRRILGLQTGDALEFDVQRGKVELRPLRPKGVSAGILKRHLPKDWKAPKIEEMDSGIARHLARRHRTE
jgi:AbrB family looped-hinge helix DNA binding protein